MALGEPHIVLENVKKSFGKTDVLKGIDMVIGRGETAVIIGGSGAGKTTLLRILIGLERPSSGKVLVGGVDIAPMSNSELNEFRKRFGMVFQYSALLDSLTVFDNVAFPLVEHTKLSKREIRDKVLTTLGVLGLENADQRFPSQLSGGMRKRVALAQTFINSPEILLMDEPFSALDMQTRTLMQDELLQLWSGTGGSVVFVTHDLEEAIALADRVFVLSARPATLKRVYEIDLPRPRVMSEVRYDPHFIELSKHIWADLREEVVIH